MSLPPSSITRYLQKLNHCPPKLMSSLEPDQLLHIFGLPLTTKWKQRTQEKLEKSWIKRYLTLPQLQFRSN
ncbi:hypothetical protein MTR_6g452910 [Medicago truncatula]|uniref:Uncharacterized protein n=1 Tax=Medicago truncatula TaxID=3880 RepID=A0A072UA83_MEDTR|nr:hypothetical protein MTR_6g452910 [Medicago truncatula]